MKGFVQYFRRVHCYGIVMVTAVFGVAGLVGCDRNALQRVFSADPKATTLSTPEGSTPEGSTALPAPVASTSASPSPSASATAVPRSVPIALLPYVEDVLQLGASETAGLFEGFSPNEPVLRGTFARWLVTVNNRTYRDRPSRQIRLAAASSPTFRDVPANNPNFAYIQGLAEAGYLPSALSGDKTQTRFRPNDPLTRETLLLWKVPIERQQILPTVSAERVKQLWGFKDTNRISVTALSAIAADRQNGDLSNIRRLFGSTLLFQPQKPVLQAEAVAALWFIGVEGEGLSAQDLLRSEQQTRSQSSEVSPSSGNSSSSSSSSNASPDSAPSSAPSDPTSIGPKRPTAQ